MSNRVIIGPLPWPQRCLARLIWLVAWLVSRSVRFRWRDESGLLQGEACPQIIFCVWHNRLALCLELYQRLIRRRWPQHQMAALVSASKDGQLLAGVLRLYGVQPVHGSSSRRGGQALWELMSAGEKGLDLAITPDGPKGPCYHVSPGIIALAGNTGLPIVPTVYHLNWKIRAKSWDRFQIPLPFARCDLHLGAPMRVPPGLPAEELERRRAELEARMQAMTRD